MMEFQEKRRVKKALYSKITLVLLLFLLFIILRGVWGVYQKQKYTKDNLEKVEDNLAELKEREERLSAEIDWLKTENGMEQEIREKYGLVKPGEEVIIIVDKKDINLVDNSENLSFWQKVLIWLK